MNKNAWKLFKQKLPATLQLSGIFSAFILLVYGILYLFQYLISGSMASIAMGLFGIFDFIMMVFIVSFVVSILSPLIYSYFAANSILDTKDEDKVGVGSFLKTYMIGIHHPIKGQLHIFSSLMWSFLLYIGVFIGVMLIAILIMSSTNAMNINDYFNQFTTLYQDYLTTNSEQSLIALENFLESPDFLAVIECPQKYANFIAIPGAFYLFVHKVVINVFRYFPSTILGGVPAKPLNPIFNLAFKETKKVFYPAYYKTIYPLIIGMLVVFFGTYIGLSFIPFIDSLLLNLTTITITSIVMLPFLPVVFNFYNDIWLKVGENYMVVFIDTAEDQLRTFQENSARFTEVEKSQLDAAAKNIEKSRQMFEEFKTKRDESNDNKKDGESNDDNPSNSEEK